MPVEVIHKTGLLTRREIATLFGVSTARIGQLEARAFRKIALAILRDRELRQIAADVCGLEPEELRAP